MKLLLVTFGYWRLFYLKLLLSIVDYFTLDIFGNFKQLQLVAIGYSFIEAISGYYINGY